MRVHRNWLVLIALSWLGCPAPNATDAGAIDSGRPDAGWPDSGTPDAGGVDSGTPDAGPHDGGTWSCPWETLFIDAGSPPLIHACDPALDAWTSSQPFAGDGGPAAIVASGQGVWVLYDPNLMQLGDPVSIFELDGGSWVSSPIGVPDQEEHGAAHATSRFWGSGPGDLWLSDPFWHWDGAGWTSLPGQPFLPFWPQTLASGTGANDMWFSDGQGSSNMFTTLHHWDGGTLADAGFAYGWDRTALWADAPGAVFAAIGGAVEHQPDLCTASFGQVQALWGVSSTDVWASTAPPDSWLFHFDGHTWSQVAPASAQSFAGNAWNDVWAANGGSGLLHWDGNGWCETQGPAGVTEVAAGGGHVYAITRTAVWTY